MSAEPPLRIPNRKADSHKGTFGRALLIGGSRGMSGSISLSSVAALHTGSGLVSAAIPDRCLETVAAIHPCVMTIPLADDSSGCFDLPAAEAIAKRLPAFSALGCGPGMTTRPGSLRMVERLIETTSLPRVFDADAINCMAELLGQRTPKQEIGEKEFGPMVLTPHPGELQRLTGVSSGDRSGQVEAANELCRRIGAVVVLKGGPTIVVDGNQEWVNSTGTPGMATAGSGDVLTGVITSLLGQGLSPWDAARLGVWVHGLSGDIAANDVGPAGMTALEMLAAIPHAIAAAVAE